VALGIMQLSGKYQKISRCLVESGHPDSLCYSFLLAFIRTIVARVVNGLDNLL